LATAVILLTVAAVLLVLPKGATAPRGAAATRHERPSTTTTSTTSTTTTLPPTTTTTGPGSLPQTNVLPTTSDPQFATEMAALWNGIVSNAPQAASPAFFPEGAYLQLKDLAGAQSDYTNRLVYDYGLDIGAAHGALAPDPAHAQFVRIDANPSFAHWVRPGVCDNGIGYYELPNSRLVYQEDGQTRSFGIASMISWRGEWYVVHLGAILRSSAAGVVADPEVGAGVPTYSSTC
jgi:hypothetical protein